MSTLAEFSMRCIARTAADRRCTRFGDIRVGGHARPDRVCRQHWRVGYQPFTLPDDAEIDPRAAARAAAVSSVSVDDDRAVLRQRLNQGEAAVFTATSCNRKLSPVEFIDVGRRFAQPRVRAPFCSSTFASIQGTCPDSCAFKMKQGRSNGCFADAGFTAMRSRRYDRAAVGLSALDVIRQEAREIRKAFGGGRVPQDGMQGGRDLRIHIGGDAPDEQCARLLGEAAADWRKRGGGDVWSYTHAGHVVPRAAWGAAAAVMASVEHASQIRTVRANGYAPALVVARFPRGHRAFDLGGIKFVPCLAETQKLTCVECRFCFRMDLHARKLGVAFQVHGQHDRLALEALRRTAAEENASRVLRLREKRALAVVA